MSFTGVGDEAVASDMAVETRARGDRASPLISTPNFTFQNSNRGENLFRVPVLAVADQTMLNASAAAGGQSRPISSVEYGQ